MLEDKRKEAERQERWRQWEMQWVKLLRLVLASLNQKLNRRLVSTFLGLVLAIILHRHRNHGLLLSELGGYLLWAEERGAGTKRISNLIRTNKWNAGLIEEFLWQEGTQRGNSYIGSYGLVTTRGEQSSQKRTEESLVLAHIDQL